LLPLLLQKPTKLLPKQAKHLLRANNIFFVFQKSCEKLLFAAFFLIKIAKVVCEDTNNGGA
jgi:hypothetical protein